MSERRISRIAYKVDHFLQRKDSLPARFLNRVSSQGEQYQKNHLLRRGIDLAIAVPASIVVIPAIGVLGLIKKLEDGGPMFYPQERESPKGPVTIRKIRTMKVNSHDETTAIDLARGIPPWEHENNTRFGSFLRKHDLDELPQILQVVTGKLSFFGPRHLPKYVIDYIKESWPKEKYDQWYQMRQHMQPGILSSASLLNDLKEDERRYYYEMFDYRNQSLGYHFYLTWRFFAKKAHLMENKKKHRHSPTSPASAASAAAGETTAS